MEGLPNKSFYDFWQRLHVMPRISLIQNTTPLQPLRHLSDLMEAEIWCKRDDLISFGFGGNKIRGLELLVADAVQQQADILVTGAGVQSNHVRATAMTACYMGLDFQAVFWGEAPERVDGNYRITRMLATDIVFTEDSERSSVDSGIEQQCDKLSGLGRKPYPIPRGGACALGALGHALAAKELYFQCLEQNLNVKTIVLATGSGGTHAGWLLGSKMLDDPWQIVSYTVSREVNEVRRQITRLANEAGELLDQDIVVSQDEVIVYGGFIGDGYGIPSAEGASAIRQLASYEAILLDPTYTGKAMAGLLERIHNGPGFEYPLVFVHSGGEPAFFAGDEKWLNI